MPDKWAQYAVPSAPAQDKWAQYAQPAQPAQATANVQPTPTATLSAPPTLGQRLTSAVAHPLNTLDSLSQPVSRPNNASLPEMATADAKNVIAGAAGVVRHPLNTAAGALSSIGGLFTAPLESAQGKQNEYQQVFNEANTNGPQMGATTLGQSLATAGLGKILPKPLGAGLELAGDTAKERGVEVLDRTVGSRLGDFKHGAEPSRAYLSSGGGPALSNEGLANNANNLLENKVGPQLGAARQAATDSGMKVPVSQVTGALRPAIKNAARVLTGPGGTGSAAPVADYARTFMPSIDAARQAGGFTPNEVSGIKGNIAQNTSWGDPTQIGMKAVRQQNVGALSSLENTYLPVSEGLKSQYQGLTNFANRATMRDLTGSAPLTDMASKIAARGTGAAIGSLFGGIPGAVAGEMVGGGITSIPVRSTYAVGLYRGGNLASQIGGKLKSLYGAPSGAVGTASALNPPRQR